MKWLNKDRVGHVYTDCAVHNGLGTEIERGRERDSERDPCPKQQLRAACRTGSIHTWGWQLPDAKYITKRYPNMVSAKYTSTVLNVDII